VPMVDCMKKKNISISLLVLSFIAVVFTAGCITNNTNNNKSSGDCNIYCLDNGYGNAVENACMDFTQCNDPNEPINTDICEGITLCCCKPK